MSIELRTNRRGEKRYEVRLRDPNGREYSRTFRKRKDAETYESNERTDRARGVWLDPRMGQVTFGSWANEWLKSDPAKSESALARDETIVRVHLLLVFEHRALATISPRDIQGLVSTWSERAKPRTVRRQYDTLRAILNAAVAADFIGRSPCRGIKLPTYEPAKRPVLGADELARLADAVGPSYGAMVYVGAVLGLRWGEVAGLRVGHVNFLLRTVRVCEQRTRGTGGAMITRQPKTAAGQRMLSAPEWLMDMLAAHLQARHLTAADPGELVFVTTEGEGLDYSHWRQRVWLPAVDQAGLKGLQFHDLRRTAATALVVEGIDIKTAQTRLGHADPRTTLGIYAQATEQADRDAAERLGIRFHPPTTGSVRGMDAG